MPLRNLKIRCTVVLEFPNNMKEVIITDDKMLAECRNRFMKEVSERPSSDHRADPKFSFSDFNWYYNEELDQIIKKRKD